MSRQVPGFRYSLHALLRKRRAELDSLTAELAAARTAVEQQQRELEGARAVVAELEQMQRHLCQQGQSIDLDARWRLYHCQGRAAAQVGEHTRGLALAQGQWHAALSRVHSGRQAVRALEEHRETRARQFAAVSVRQDLAVADELYLANQLRPGQGDDRGFPQRRL